MAGIKYLRRWLQFRLRSLMLLILLVALWLGFEARHANWVGRHVAAIRDAGGQVEFDHCWWSLLRYIDAERYGARVASAEVRADVLDDLWEDVAGLRDAREIRIAFDGTSDSAPAFDRLARALPNVRITPIVVEITGDISTVYKPLRARDE